MKTAGLAFVFLWFLIGGIAHFIATAAEMRIVPPYIPWPRVAVLVSGVFEQQFDVPYWLLVLRLPLQCALLALIAFAVIRPYTSGGSIARSK
jgi:uncharacterized membrane protein